MAKFKDLTGQRFGRLTVLRRGDDYISPSGKRTVRWICKCDCGKEIAMLRNTLLSAQSCGCIRAAKNADKMRDLSGLRFGKWAVLSKATLQHEYANGLRTGWLCRCDCGAEKVIPARSLTSGASRSCGCETTKKATSRLEVGNVLGRYDGTVISAIQPDRPPNRNNKSGVRGVYWSDSEQRFIAKIGVRGQTITIGRYRRLEDAAKARREAEDRYFTPILASFEDSHPKR